MNHDNDPMFSSSSSDTSPNEVARALADWPLLAMLAAGRTGLTPPHTGDASFIETAGPIFIPPAPPPPTPPSPMAEIGGGTEPEAVIVSSPARAEEVGSEPEPVHTPVVGATSEPGPAMRGPGALEQLFSRADKSSQGQPIKRTMFRQSGPPPLKTPSQAPADRTSGPAGAITIEPRQRELHDLETVPDRLFDRVGGR